MQKPGCGITFAGVDSSVFASAGSTRSDLFFADFACLESMLVVELDGGQHAEEHHVVRDAVRSDVLSAHGFTVLRFWDNDVLRNTPSVLEAIRNALGRRQS
jgi:Uncharacterized protein conserved in bacteria